MGLDIYAGTLTRYYSHNWKTVVQQWAEENGYAFTPTRSLICLLLTAQFLLNCSVRTS